MRNPINQVPEQMTRGRQGSGKGDSVASSPTEGRVLSRKHLEPTGAGGQDKLSFLRIPFPFIR